MRVICNILNGADEISGVKFGPQESGQRVSEEISDEQGQRFLTIPGFLPYVERVETDPQSGDSSAEAHAQDGSLTEDDETQADAQTGDDQGAGGPSGPEGPEGSGDAKTGEGKPSEPAEKAAKPDAKPAKKKK